MTKVYKAVYTSGYDVRNVTVTAYFPVGYREREEPTDPVPVLTTSLDAEPAAKIDWGANVYDLEAGVVPKAWKVVFKREGF
jgi:hypothetical protein